MRFGDWIGRIAQATGNIAAALAESGTSLTELCGIGTLTAGKILARVGSIHRFRSAAAFASYTRTDPIEASSGDIVRHRLSRAGDRQLNCAPHTMAITQIGRDTPGRAYTNGNAPRKESQGSIALLDEATLRRRLSAASPRLGDRAGGRPGGHSGAAGSA